MACNHCYKYQAFITTPYPINAKEPMSN